jgi:hypothetical protein
VKVARAEGQEQGSASVHRLQPVKQTLVSQRREIGFDELIGS